MDLKIFLLITALSKVSALKDEKGHFFMLSFLKANINDGSLFLFITAENSTCVSITIPFLGQHFEFNITSAESVRIPLSTSLRFSNWHGTSNQGIKITATPSEVTVMAQDYTDLSGSGYMALPFDVLSTSYIAVMYEDVDKSDGFDSVILLIGIHNFTMVTVTYRVDGNCDGYVTGDEASYSLNEYDVYGITCTGHFTGTYIVSNYPIAVINGHEKMRVTQDGQDAVQEMLLPVDQFGQSYVIFNQRAWNRGTIHRIVAVFDDTVVTSSTGIMFYLNAFEYSDVDTTGMDPMCITADKPIEIVSFTRSYNHNGMNGDNFMSIVLPTSTFGTSLLLKMQLSDTISSSEYINATIIVDRREINFTAYSTVHDVISDCHYDVYTMPVEWPLAINTGGFKIGVYVYGTYGSMRNGYGHPVLGNFVSVDTVSTEQWTIHESMYATEDGLFHSGFMMSTGAGNHQDPMISYSHVKQTGLYNIFNEIQPSIVADSKSNEINTFLWYNSLQETLISSGMDMSTSAPQETISSIKLLQPVESTIDNLLNFSSISKESGSTIDNIQSRTSNLIITPIISTSGSINAPASSSVEAIRATFTRDGVTPSLDKKTLITQPTASKPIIATGSLTLGVSHSLPSVSSSEKSANLFKSLSSPSTSLFTSIFTWELKSGSSPETPVTPLQILQKSSDFSKTLNTIVESATQQQQDTSSETPPSQSLSSTPVTPAATSSSEDCGCICVPKPGEITPEWVQMVRMKIGRKLLVETRNLSKTIRKHTCAKDDRPSAVQVGSLGIVLMIIVSLVIFLPDLFHLVIHNPQRTRMVFKLR